MGSCAGRCHQLYEAVVPDDVDAEEDAQLRRRRERCTLCLAILSVVVAIIIPIVTAMIPASKENVCDAYLTSLAKDMMLPYHYEFPNNYVNRTGLSTELAELVERSRAPRSEIRLIVVLGRRQVGKTSVVLEQFTKKTNVYYHALEARAMQLGSDRTTRAVHSTSAKATFSASSARSTRGVGRTSPSSSTSRTTPRMLMSRESTKT